MSTVQPNPSSDERAAAPGSDQAWLKAPEMGHDFGLRFLVMLATALGRKPVQLALYVIVFYYALFARKAMAASRQYLVRMQAPHGFWDCYKHLVCFAQCAADRWFFVTGRRDLFEIEAHGHEHLTQAQRNGRGALLLGAHLGSFEVLHAAGIHDGLVINVVGYFRNAQRINALLASFGGGVQTRLIEVEPGNINFMLRLRRCIERGEFIAVLADRSVHGDATVVDFLGDKARLPTGPYMLAATLGCPVFTTAGLYRGGARYDVYCEPFADSLSVPRKGRAEALQAYAQKYADWLSGFCRLAPNNWFNFYDFWSHDH